MRNGQLWRWWLAIGVLATAAFSFVPAGTVAWSIALDAVGLAAGLAILVAVRVHRPDRPAMWYWIAAGQFAAVFGDITYGYYQFVLEQEPYPSLADVFYLASYPLNVTGLLLLVRRRRGTAAEIIDAAIVAVGLCLVFWVFVLHPIAADSSASILERIISTTYPAGDVLLLGLLARLVTGTAALTPSIRLLGVAVTLVLVADTGFSLVTLYWDAEAALFDVVFMLSYLGWAGAALHPSMAAATATAGPAAEVRVGPGRLLMFGACSLLAPVMLFVPGVGANAADRIAVGAGSAALLLLVIARMSGFVSKVQRQSVELRRAAEQDDLTGLANRRRFDVALREALSGGHSQVAFLGLNGFKNVNDELGRPVGDRVLSGLAGRLVGSVPPGALVARMGGDEFAVLLADATADEAEWLAGALVEALREPVSAGGHDLLVGVTVGLADGTAAGSAAADGVEVLRRAEAAMYAAKHTGEPVRRWTAELDENAGRHARLGAEIRTGLDAGQFRVFYQPIVDVPAGRVAGVEALVRWEHPERGLISPALFVPVAEQNGLIVELGEWIMRTACHRLAGWRAELGPHAPDRVSVNVSARQLSRPGFAGTVAAALAESGLPASCLAVEVTETAVFVGGQAVTALHELRALGVWIALDDFGTGHSSLGLLQTVPVDILKVDKSFVDDITSAGRHAVIAEALIQVCAGLGLAAVAEGVETAEQAEALCRRGYRLLQGYHYGHPSPDPDFARVRAAVAA
ncbi:MAG TPA: bifunctional diguanylate cyclase/phosphodiesterase [Actinoplanes sp.]